MPNATGADPELVTLLDTSTAVALVLEDHEAHVSTFSALRGRRLGLAGHAWFETYSVLTRLPAGIRLSPVDALRVLERNVPASRFLGEAEAARLARELPRLGISGGSVFDALVAATAQQHRRPLATRDARARPVYDSLGVQTELISRREG
jgi:predicted nucleic acid-binding protein